jgi:hypothetical protein
MSLNLLEEVKKHKIRHRPEDTLKLRIGIHTGNYRTRTPTLVKTKLKDKFQEVLLKKSVVSPMVLL